MKRDIFSEITDKLLQAMEQSRGDWQKPWIPMGFGLAINAKTKKYYNGGNAFLLGMMGGGEWATFKQWQSMGCKVRKGEKGTPCVYWSPKEKVRDDGQTETFLIPCGFTVFSAKQVDGYEPEPITERPEIERFAAAEEIVAATGADIRHAKQDRAYYSPVADYIGMPMLPQFHSQGGYYSTLLHELTHWTGHSSRLARIKTGGKWGDEDYAFEELVAEIGSAFLLARCGLSVEPRQDHAQYLASWIKHCKKDSKLFYKAASKAQAAVDFICGNSTTEEQEEAA